MKIKTLVMICLALTPAFANAAKVDKEKIRQVMKTNEKTIRDCYEAAITKQPDLKGKVVVDWEVDEAGTVSSANVNSKSTDLKNDAVGTCIVAHLKSWNFPPAPKGEKVSVSYPWYCSN